MLVCATEAHPTKLIIRDIRFAGRGWGNQERKRRTPCRSTGCPVSYRWARTPPMPHRPRRSPTRLTKRANAIVGQTKPSPAFDPRGRQVVATWATHIQRNDRASDASHPAEVHQWIVLRLLPDWRPPQQLGHLLPRWTMDRDVARVRSAGARRTFPMRSAAPRRKIASGRPSRSTCRGSCIRFDRTPPVNTNRCPEDRACHSTPTQ